MSESIVPSRSRPGIRIVPYRLTALLATIARKAIDSHLTKITRGQITLLENGKRRTYGATGASEKLRATVTVHDPAFYTDMAFGGSLGAAEAYTAGFWWPSRGGRCCCCRWRWDVLVCPGRAGGERHARPFHAGKWRGTAYGAKFVLALGAAASAIPVIAWVHETTGGFTLLYILLGAMALLVMLSALLLPSDRAPAATAAPVGAAAEPAE